MMKMTMKRLLSLVLVVTMVLTMVPGTFVSAEEAAKPTFSVDNVAAMAGESVYIPVRITENTGFGAVVLRFTLPEGWTMESIDDFYASIDEKIDKPAEALKLDAVPVAVIGDIPVDMPESKAEIQERILVQTEAMQAQKAAMREKQTEIEMLELRLEMAERILEE